MSLAVKSVSGADDETQRLTVTWPVTSTSSSSGLGFEDQYIVPVGQSRPGCPVAHHPRFFPLLPRTPRNDFVALTIDGCALSEGWYHVELHILSRDEFEQVNQRASGGWYRICGVVSVGQKGRIGRACSVETVVRCEVKRLGSSPFDGPRFLRAPAAAVIEQTVFCLLSRSSAHHEDFDRRIFVDTVGMISQPAVEPANTQIVVTRITEGGCRSEIDVTE